MFNPDPNKKAKRPPPLPSFSSSKTQHVKKDNDMDKKLDSFFAQINNQVLNNKPQSSTKQTQVSQEEQAVKAQAGKQQGHQICQPVPQKKKSSLAIINSKLNSMLSAKKINLNTIVGKTLQQSKSSQVSNQQKVQKKQRNELPGEYDPNMPNNYDLSRHFYSQKLAQLQRDSDQEQSNKMSKIINKTGLGMQNLAEQIKSQQQIPETVQEEVLQEKQQVALRMMQKFGYKAGTGLGKQGQGITTPLTIKKTTDSSCVIQQSTIPLNQLIKPQILAKNALMAHHINITQVILFIDLIRVQEMTQSVEKELKEECSLFGQIKNWIVFLNPVQSINKVETRIFVEYEKKDQAFMAFCKLNNRFYRLNLASIRFYPKQSFEKYQLYLPVHSHVQT